MPVRGRYQHQGVEGVRVGRFNRGINTTFICYRIEDTLFDSGPANQWPEVESFVAEKPVRQLLITHHHEDHSANAAAIAAKFNITPYAPTQALDKLRYGYKTPLIQQLFWGKPNPVKTQPFNNRMQLYDGSPIVPVHTPGHARDLTCFYLPQQGYLFSGDLYLAKSIRYLRIDEDLNQLMASMRLALTLDFDTLLCPHRGPVKGGKTALAAKLNNMRELCGRAQQLSQQGLPLKQVVKRLLGSEDLTAYLSRHNFCKTNLIRAAIDVENLD
ncbi:MBL fold metallo-hydrolase [Ferrimonas lipolytica]|uniref:MBL fold metallo-hydrolase n=1 Tax=Ferrimonas lipolytica TaxID=2724191 RepID=A0A6H1UDC9_9GAMM|nr:MBL fold metallo-hydrolase [Ferrimonas lipolytica]QIZ77044.1 MBL fold metallo-hydrolase [Ferrimonas lipolytica]